MDQGQLGIPLLESGLSCVGMNRLFTAPSMEDGTTTTSLHQLGSVIDPLTEIARDGARQMLTAALRAEAASFVAQFAEERLPDGRQRVVHHGAGPERTIQTGIGPIPVQRHTVRDRTTDEPPENNIRFSSRILPKWARRSPSLDALIPVLYLRGISTWNFQEALSALLGPDAPNLSPSAISRIRRRNTMIPDSSRPATLQLFLPRSSPGVIIVMARSFSSFQTSAS